MTHLSDTFKYISHFRHAGHQVGRKIGDMLEILTYAAIARDPEMLSRLHVEPKLHGFTDAGHKVEFILLDQGAFDEEGEPEVRKGGSITDPSNVISFIECKRVGVEQTVNGKFKKTFPKNGNNRNYRVHFEHEFTISFAPRGGEKHTYTVVFNTNREVKITKKEDRDFLFTEAIKDDSRIIFTLSDAHDSEVIGNNESLRTYEPTLQNCRILEIVTVDDDGVCALLNDCLAGPQTPEKAKQSSFVALDVRKNRFDSFDKRMPENEMVSVLVMTEFSHWEPKSQNMVKACIDKNFVVEDHVIIRAFQIFEQEFGADFYERISKDNFEKNPDVRRISLGVIDEYKGKIFIDLDDNIKKKFVIQNNQFSAVP